MIAPLNMGLRALSVLSNRNAFAHLELLRVDAAAQMDAVFKDVSGKRINDARVPGCGRHGVSRAINGSETNPLFRIIAMFVLMRRLGLGRERALRLVEWIRSMVDVVWPPEAEPALDDVLEKDADLDVKDDAVRVRALRGDAEARRCYLAARLEQAAYTSTVVAALHRQIAEEGTGCPS